MSQCLIPSKNKKKEWRKDDFEVIFVRLEMTFDLRNRYHVCLCFIKDEPHLEIKVLHTQVWSSESERNLNDDG